MLGARSSGVPDPDYEKRMQAKLDPFVVRSNFVTVGLVLSTYELVKAEVIEGARGFFAPLDTGQDRYREHVLSRAPKSTFEASCLSLLEMKALREGDYETLKELQKHRGKVAHELPAYLMDPNTEVDINLVLAAADILRRLGQFWGRIAVDTNEDFDGREIADEDIRSGGSLFVDFLLGIALADGT